MLAGIRTVLQRHVKSNIKTYFLLALFFAAGVSAGAFTVNGLSAIQRDELGNYFKGFLQILDNQKIDGSELLKISIFENARVIAVLWVLGVTIIGIPFIYLIVGVRGFVSGFSSGFIIKTFGLKGVLFSFFGLLPKELILVPCIIALGVSGINFSLNIIKSRSSKHLSRESLKANFAAYCIVTAAFSMVILAGSLVEAYIIPVFIRLIAPIVI